MFRTTAICPNYGRVLKIKQSVGKEKDFITREGVFRHMWMNTELTEDHKKYIYEEYPNILELHCCIREFRHIFEKRNIPLLYLFVEKYSKSNLKSLKSFADELSGDIDAIENAVAYEYNNDFVEGTNSRLKMIKRTMYGRCGKRLLEAKLRYHYRRLHLQPELLHCFECLVLKL